MYERNLLSEEGKQTIGNFGWLIVLVFFIFGCGTNASLEREAGAEGSLDKPVEISLMPYKGVLKSIEARVGSITYPFLFDTAGGMTFITPMVADQIGATPFGRVTAFRMTGERLDMPRCGKLEFQISDIPIRSETLLFDLMSLLPEDWPEVGGLFSLDTFSGRAVTLELSKNRLTIETPSSLEKRIRSMNPVNIRINHQTGGWGLDIFVEVKADRGSLWLELDSGNMTEVLLAPHAIEQLGLGIPFPAGEEGDGDPETFNATLDISGFGPVDVRARIAELIYDGALNFTTMEKFVLTIDLKNGRMWMAFPDAVS